jgi:hypothetical protein
MEKTSLQNSSPIPAEVISTPIPTSEKFQEAKKRLPETLAKLKAFNEKQKLEQRGKKS